MSEQTVATDSVVVTYTEEVPSFLDNSVKLDKLLRELVKHGKKAVEVLVEVLDSEKVDLKTKMAAATKLLEFQVSVAKEVSTDQLQRLIAEVKLVKNPSKRLVPGEEHGQNTPLVDFVNIRKID